MERDAEKLARVAVLRLCGPYSREVPPFAGFPRQLRSIIEGHTAYLSGGVESNTVSRKFSIRHADTPQLMDG